MFRVLEDILHINSDGISRHAFLYFPATIRSSVFNSFLILLADETTFGQLFPRYFDILPWAGHFHSAQPPIIFRLFHDFE
ncbi:hypothetical protein NBRC3257_2459 [Gluconobacter thailandicus NBRC 3257]|uniref:Transposase n=1 Tax=Gluconobacter thailandicus NBRC 3257 TaxID=1381097 RepID=A0ABQ0IZ28_GLUTH|nr:hypothetical protein NBRC3257_2459 [Gluconobacter thailandicus NBRC 3257]